MIILRRKDYKDQPILRCTTPLNGDDLLDLAREILKTADRIWCEDRRAYANYDLLVGYLLGVARDMHDLTDEQYNQMVDLLQTDLANRRREDYKGDDKLCSTCGRPFQYFMKDEGTTLAEVFSCSVCDS